MLPPSNNKRENDVQTAEPEDNIQAQVFASAAASASLGMTTITSLCSYIQDAVKGRSSNADDLPFLGEYYTHTHTRTIPTQT